MGVGDLVGRLVIGPLITFWNLDVTKIYAVSQVFCAILIASFPLVVNGIQMVFLAVLIDRVDAFLFFLFHSFGTAISFWNPKFESNFWCVRQCFSEASEYLLAHQL